MSTVRQETARILEPVVQRTRQGSHLGYAHSVAAVARRHCRQSHQLSAGAMIGGVACGMCWEEAIRADERLVVEDCLERYPASQDCVDEVAIERYVGGDKVRLTATERVLALREYSDRAAKTREAKRRPAVFRSTARAERVWPPVVHLDAEAAQ